MSTFLTQCTRDELKPDSAIRDDVTIGEIDPYAGGVRLENPYDVVNMKMALDTIKAKLARGEYTYANTNTDSDNNDDNDSGNRMMSIFDEFDVAVSHRYVKFTPQTEDEVAILKQDSTLFVVDYPLDHDFPDSYFENRPELSEGQVPEYYTSIAVDKAIPNVNHQILGDLYIPEEDSFFDVNTQPFTKETVLGNEEDLIHHLLYEAYALKGREAELEADKGVLEGPNGNRLLIFGRRWTPSGTIQVFDNRAGITPGGVECYDTITPDYTVCEQLLFDDNPYDPDAPIEEGCTQYIITTDCVTIPESSGKFVPVPGAQVLMRQFFTVRQGITNQDGTFTTGTVRGRAKYVIQWERHQYSIRDGLLYQAELKGPTRRDVNWNKLIGSQEDQYHAMIHIAAHEYYYGDRQGTHTPPRNSPVQRQMKIAAQEIDASSSHIPYFSAITAGLYPQIQLKSWGEPTDEIFGTTVHELAHAAHRNLDFIGYNSLVLRGYTLNGASSNPTNCDHRSARRLMETWAKTVEIQFALERYRNLPGGEGVDYEYKNENYQIESIFGNQFYTSVGRDLIDDFNQRIENNNINLPSDNVDSYTLKQLEDALVGANTWLQWRLQLADLFDNPTENNLPQLFDTWN